MPKSEQIQQLERPDEERYDFWDRKEEWYMGIRQLFFPEPNDFEPLLQPTPFDLKGKYGKRGFR